MVQGGATFAKYLLFFFNLLFVLTGLAVIIVGAVIEVRARDYFNFLGAGFTSTAVLLIVVGVIIFLIAFFGCCGAVKENHCMVLTFSILLFLVFLCEFSAGIAAYVYRGKLNGILTDGMEENLKKFETDKEVEKTWNEMQKKFDCCGARNYSDYAANKFKVPMSCCKENTTTTVDDSNSTGTNDTCSDPFPKGCADKLFDEVNHYQTTIGGVGIGIGFIQIVGIVLACCLARSIKKAYEVV